MRLRGCVNASEGVSRIYSFGSRQPIRSFIYFGTRHINGFDAHEDKTLAGFPAVSRLGFLVMAMLGRILKKPRCDHSKQGPSSQMM
jgi:hypothetical protein